MRSNDLVLQMSCKSMEIKDYLKQMKAGIHFSVCVYKELDRQQALPWVLWANKAYYICAPNLQLYPS